jgi:hypothetical protein
VFTVEVVVLLSELGDSGAAKLAFDIAWDSRDYTNWGSAPAPAPASWGQPISLNPLAGAGFSVLMAPQILRIDLRQDLRHLELLKTWPVKSSAVIRGEIAWPGALITVSAWVLISLALLLSTANFSRIDLGWRLGVAAAAMLVAPALVFAQLTIHNGVALMFPAWVPLGNQRARGLDAMGQRLIMLGGTWLLLIVMTAPGAFSGAIVWFAFRTFLGPGALLLGAIVCAMVVGIEVLVATEALGPLYERLDVLAVERAE